MASVADTCADLIRRFPDSYANRTQALHHLLHVLGNGYHWRHGELVNTSGDTSTQEDALDMVLRPLIRRLGAHHPIVTSAREEITTAEAATLWRRDQADHLARTPGPLEHEVYPLSSGSALATMPADATPDWQAAAREITAAVHHHSRHGRTTPTR